jgi:hypothetical protein
MWNGLPAAYVLLGHFCLSHLSQPLAGIQSRPSTQCGMDYQLPVQLLKKPVRILGLKCSLLDMCFLLLIFHLLVKYCNPCHLTINCLAVYNKSLKNKDTLFKSICCIQYNFFKYKLFLETFEKFHIPPQKFLNMQ